MVQTVVIWGITVIAATALAGILAAVKSNDYSFWKGWSFICPQ
jgi:hypothetical protein